MGGEQSAAITPTLERWREEAVRESIEHRRAGSGPYNDKPYWSSDEMLDPQRTIPAVWCQRQADCYVAHDGQALHAMTHRELSVPRHVFGNIAAASIATELRTIAPTALTAGELELGMTWLDKSSGAPICRAK